jgi:hypothetical protein
MSNGGFRPGAGRKPGVPNRTTQAKRAEIEAAGLTPLDYMLSVMRDEALDTAVRMEAAKAAGHYVHPRLSAISAKVEGGVDIRAWMIQAEREAVAENEKPEEV